MTFPRRGTRTITVDGAAFRWRASLVRGSDPTLVVLVAQTAKSPARSTLDLRLWKAHCDILLPEIVAALIRSALAHGWDPEARGTYAIGPYAAMKMLPDGLKPGDIADEQRLARRSRAGPG